MSTPSSSSSLPSNVDDTPAIASTKVAEETSQQVSRQTTEISSTATTETTSTSTAKAEPVKKAMRRIIRRKGKGGSSKRKGNDDDSGINPALLEKVMKESNLPQAYSFEITKTVQRINQILQLKIEKQKQRSDNNNDNNKQDNETTVSVSVTVHIALQMPEGLLLYATVLSDVLQRLVTATNTKTVTDNNITSNLLSVSVLGDVTYGACCVDDLGARALGCDLLVHYGHSCLVPIQHTVIPCLYVFVEITIDVPHLVECFHQTILLLLQQKQKQVGNGGDDDDNDTTTTHKPHVYLLGTIQFRHALMEARRLLRNQDTYNYDVSIPQAKPLSPGEVLGCTSPVLTSSAGAVVLFVADGRFHLESTMISNPDIYKFYRYDPYPKSLTEETYDHIKMKSIRYEAITKARKQMNNNNDNNGSTNCVFGIILGTLGRQGNPALLTKIQTQLSKKKGVRSFVMLASEITPAKLALFANKVHVWVQIACPRLSVDWGHHLSGNNAIPVLNPYELFVCLGVVEWRGSIDGDENNEDSSNDKSYPMDYYSQDGGPWSNYHDVDNKNRKYTTIQQKQ